MTPFRTRPIRRSTAVACATLAAGIALAGIALAGAASSATATPASPAGRLHTVRTEEVQLTVPVGWHVDPATPGCMVADGVHAPAKDAPYGVTDCQLQVTVGARLINDVDANTLYFAGDPVVCHRGDASVGWRTQLAGSARVGHVAAEFRRFTLPCTSRAAEQWFLAGPPGVLVQRTSENPTTERAAREAVLSATVPAKRVGYPRSASGLLRSAPGGGGVDLAGVRLYRSGDGTSSFNTAWTQDARYDLVSRTRIFYRRTPGSVRELTPAQFRHDVAHGFPGVTAGQRAIANVQSTTGARVDTIEIEVSAQP